MATLRPVSNLVVPDHLMMPRAEQKARFMYVYNKGYKGKASVFMTRLWAAPLFPSLAFDPKFGHGGAKADAELHKKIPAGFLTLKKVDDGAAPGFIASVPLFHFPVSSPTSPKDFLSIWMTGAHKKMGNLPQDKEETHLEVSELVDQLKTENRDVVNNVVIPKERVIQSLRLPGPDAMQLGRTLQRVRVQTKGNLAVIFADFFITKAEAQQLTTTEWAQLRNIDLYPLLHHWVEVVFGDRGPVSLASFPISKIALSLPATHTQAARINDDCIAITPDGYPAYLPREVNKQQTFTYEDRYTNAGAREDGSFALHSMDEGAMSMSSGTELKTKLPVNMVVSVDWVNNKFAYTNTTGRLTVLDLTRYRKADVSHIRNLMDDRNITVEMIDMMAKLGAAAGVAESQFAVRDDEIQFEGISPIMKHDLERSRNNPADYFRACVKAYKALEEQDNVKASDLSKDSPFLPFRPLARHLTLIGPAIVQNLEAVYLKYSVATVTEVLPWILMIGKYADTMTTLRADDTTNRHAALNQGVDPDWTPPSIPLMSDKIGFLPHQAKVRNILKDSPDFALLPVQAGGGKSLLLLTDILYEIKANRNQPYLVLCPGHLVANYVKEVVDFTGGKMNVIAITNSAIRQSGYKRLQAIMEAAPRNTAVVVDYDTLRFRPKALTYGTTPIRFFPVIDFLRQFNFGYVALDESHKVKNDSTRTKAVMELITDIPKKRLASGTMVHDSPSDMVMQVATLDPTLFGSREDFIEKYALEARGGRVIKWKPGAQQAIMAKIKSRIVVAGAMRKEWAALLPKKREWVGGVTLRPAQQELYMEILTEQLKKMEEAAKHDAKVAQFLGKASKKLEDEEDVPTPEDLTSLADQVDEDEGEDLEAAIKPYLAPLERFLIAPNSVAPGRLKGEDLISPKAEKILERIKLHLFGGKDDEGNPYGPFPGKVLIFTNNIASAEEIFRLAPPELKKCGLLYKAERKLEDGAKFEKSPAVKWMVGVEQSMNEGLNFQFAARLIRTETPWNPGVLEQGNSRINRPELKKKEERKEIFFDTIVANHTIDITKQARLIAKVIAAAKFENADNAEYQTIPDVDMVVMNRDSILNMNSWQPVGDNPGLVDYAMALRKYEEVRDEDYRQYKEAYVAKYGKEPSLEPIEVAPTPPDAKLLKRVPYTPGLGLYNAKELGLVRLDEFFNISDTDDSSDEEDDDDVTQEQLDKAAQAEREEKARALKGRAVHTEHGDGVIAQVSPNGKMVTIDLVSGYSVRARKSQVFLITRSETSTKDIRNQLLKAVGDMPIATPVDVPAAFLKPPKGVLKKQQEQEKIEKVKEDKVRKQKMDAALSLELSVVVSNGFLGLTYLVDEQNPTAMQTLNAVGFRPIPEYYYAKVRNAVALKNQTAMWKEHGLRLDPLLEKQGVKEAFAEMYDLLKSGQIKNHKMTIRQMAGQRVVNFYRLEHKASNNKKLFKPYPIIENGIAYIALPANGQAGTREAMRLRRPSYVWHKSEPTMAFFGTKQKLNAVIAKLRAAGVTITNIKEIAKIGQQLRMMKVRDPESSDLV